MLTPETETVLFGFDEALEHGNLHVELDLEILEVLVLLELMGQLVQKTLDFVILGGHLGAMGGLLVLHILSQIGDLLVQSQIGTLQVRNLADQSLDSSSRLLQLLAGTSIGSSLLGQLALEISNLNESDNVSIEKWFFFPY